MTKRNEFVEFPTQFDLREFCLFSQVSDDGDDDG